MGPTADNYLTFSIRREIAVACLLSAGIIPLLTIITYVLLPTGINESILAVFFVSFSFLFPAISDAIYDDYFSPIGLLGFTWFLSIGLSSLKLAPQWQTSWTLETWGAILLSLVAFVVGCAVIHFSLGVPRRTTHSSVNERTFVRAAIYGLFALSSLAFIIQVVLMHYSVGLDLYLTRPVKARSAFWITGLGHLYLLGLFNLLLIVAYSVRYKFSITLAAMFVFTFATLPFRGKKRLFIIATFGTLVAANYARNRDWSFSLISFIPPFIIGSVSFVAFAVVTGSTNAEYVASGAVQLPEELSLLARPYLYATTNFANLQAALQADITHSYGIRSLLPLLKLTFVQDLLGLPESFNHVYYGSRFNAFTYLGTLYYDFGWAGILLGPMFIGTVSTMIYRACKVTQTIPAIVMYSIVSSALLFAFFGSLFSVTVFWLILGASILLYVGNNLSISHLDD